MLLFYVAGFAAVILAGVFDEVFVWGPAVGMFVQVVNSSTGVGSSVGRASRGIEVGSR